MSLIHLDRGEAHVCAALVEPEPRGHHTRMGGCCCGSVDGIGSAVTAACIVIAACAVASSSSCSVFEELPERASAAERGDSSHCAGQIEAMLPAELLPAESVSVDLEPTCVDSDSARWSTCS